MQNGGGKGPHRGQRPLPTSVYSLSSLRDPEQLGDYNHRGNAAGQADKRGLRAGLGGWSGLSVHLSVCLALSQNNRGKKRQPVHKLHDCHLRCSFLASST